MFSKTTMVYTRRRWREGSTGACFSWPSEETIKSYATTSDHGDQVTLESKLPGWRRRVMLGLNATTPFIGERRRFEYSEGHAYAKRRCGASEPPLGWGHIEEYGDLSQGLTVATDLPAAPSGVVNNDVHGRAMMRFIRECRAAQGAFRGATWMAELADTIRTIRNPARTLRRGIDDYVRDARRAARKANNGRRPPVNRAEAEELLRREPKRARAMGRAVTDSWLEYQFGWQPLVSDIGNGVLAGLRLSRRLTPRKRVNAVESEKADPTVTIQSRGVAGHTLDWEVHTFTESSVLFYGAVTIEVDSPSLGITQEFGLRARDFAPALWEIIPYSFLIDYFSNLGDVVEVLSFPKSDIQWVARTVRNSSIRDCTRTRIRRTGSSPPASGSYLLMDYTPSTYRWERTYIDRHAYSDSLAPRLVLEIPGSSQFRKYLNMGALAGARFLR